MKACSAVLYCVTDSGRNFSVDKNMGKHHRMVAVHFTAICPIL